MSDDTFRGQDTIVSLPKTDAAGTQFPVINTVESYWNTLRGDRLAPNRADIDPRKLETALSACFILERLAPNVARFRLAGTHLNDLMGMEVRGMPLTSLFMPRTRSSVSNALEQVFAAPGVARMLLSGDRGIGKPPLDAAMVLLPLLSDLGEVTRILGCLPTLGPVGRTPRRFEVKECRVTPVVPSAQTGIPDRDGWQSEAPRALEGMLDGMAEAPATFRAAPASPRTSPQAPRPPRSGKPHLYLVKSEDDD